jgi:hypothetical protein
MPKTDDKLSKERKSRRRVIQWLTVKVEEWERDGNRARDRCEWIEAIVAYAQASGAQQLWVEKVARPKWAQEAGKIRYESLVHSLAEARSMLGKSSLTTASPPT